MSELPERDSNGKLPAFAWPGGYTIKYYDKCGNVLCADCASREDVDYSQEVIACDIYYEGPTIQCDDCNEDIESAYGDPGTLTVTAPAYWESYLINGDASGMEDEEQATCDAWIDRLFEDNPGIYGPVDCKEIGFCHSCDAGTLAGDMCEYTFLKN